MGSAENARSRTVFKAAGLTQPGTIGPSDQFFPEMRRRKYEKIVAELRIKQDRVYRIQHELRYRPIFHNAAARADYNKVIIVSPKASK